MFRLRGKGVKSVRGGATGDLLCKVTLETPVKLNAEQKELLQQFEASLNNASAKKHKPKSEGFFDGVKSFFDDFTK